MKKYLITFETGYNYFGDVMNKDHVEIQAVNVADAIDRFQKFGPNKEIISCSKVS